MRVRKRNGAIEPVDVNKIVRAVSRCCAGLARRRRDARRDQDHQRPLRRRDDARARPALDPDGRGAHRRGAASTRSSRRGCWRRTSTRKCATRRSTRSRSRSRTAHRLGLINERLRDVRRRRTRASSTTRSTPSATASSSTSACARVYDRYLLQAPETRAGDRDAAAVLPAHRLRAGRDAWPRRSSSIGCSRRSSTCRARRRCSTRARARAAVELLPARLAGRSPGGDLRQATRTSRCSRSSPAASASRTTACARAAR